MQLRSITSALVAPPIPPRPTLTGAQTRSAHSRENVFHLGTILESVASVAEKGILPKGVSFELRWTSLSSGINVMSGGPQEVVSRRRTRLATGSIFLVIHGTTPADLHAAPLHIARNCGGETPERLIFSRERRLIVLPLTSGSLPAMWPWLTPLRIPRNQTRFLLPPLHRTNLTPTWTRPQSPPQIRRYQIWLPNRIRMTSRMETKSVVKFAYVVHREICRLSRQLRVCQWIFSPLFHRRLSRLETTRRLKITSNLSRKLMCIHHHRFVNRATRRNFTLPMTLIPLPLIVPQTTR